MDIKSALIVDNSKIARMTLKKQLESRGIDVSETESGEQAIDFLSTSKPDIIFMDCIMSGMDGFETTRQIHSTPDLSAPPIVMCTGKESDKDKQKALNLGAVGYLYKSSSPEPLDTLLNELSTLMTQKQDPANSPERGKINSPERKKINSPARKKTNSPEPGSESNVISSTKNTKLYDINKITQIAEQSASKIAEQISHKIAASVAEKISHEQIAAMSTQHSQELNTKLTTLTEQLEYKVIFSIKAALEEIHGYIDKQIECINQDALPVLKNGIINSVKTSADKNQLLLKEVEEIKTQFNQHNINHIIERQCEQYLLNHLPAHLSAFLKNNSTQKVINSMIQDQLFEHKAKLEQLEAKAGSSSIILSWLALFLGAGALSVSAYLFLQ
ncbi:MAG: response regulator [Gammaproteobacteria bacterium]|nr:response regulator [Gammaproteobacteria bacterium]